MLTPIGPFLAHVGRLLADFLQRAYLAGNPPGDPLALPVDVRRVFPKEAEEVAERLLQEVLGPSYAQLQEQGYIDLPSRLHPGVVYRLRRQQPIEVFRGGRREGYRVCVIPSEALPAADELLVKLLWLQANEAQVLAVGNRIR